jgi:hypothetical protein
MTATIVATTEPTATPPRVRLNITTDQTTLTLYRVAADGTKTVVRSYDGGPFPVSGTALVAYDPEAPFGLPVSYTADGSGVTNSGVVTLTVDQGWLTHPGVPTRSRSITVRSWGERSYAANQSVRYPLGRKYPIVASDGRRKAAVYDLTVLTSTLADMGDLESMLDDLAPLLLQIPSSKGWGLVSEYVAVGDVKQGRIVRIAAEPMREWTLPCSVVARPPGGSQVYNTYAKSTALYATYAARKAAHTTYGAAFNAP